MADFKISRIRFTWTGDWTTATAYTKDDIVRYGGKSYVCLVGHTSATDFYTDLNYINLATQPFTPEPKWQLWFDGYEWKEDWTTSTFYNVGDIVKYGAIVYICNSSHTSAATEALGLEYNQTKWTSYARADRWAQEWQPLTRYRVNDVVKYNGLIYRCTVGHTSAATVNIGLEFNQSNWTIITFTEYWQDVWQPEFRYRRGDIVRYGGRVYRCTAGHTASASEISGLEPDISKWEIVHSGIEYKSAWAADTRYKLNDIVKYGANMYICTAYHTSSLIFSPGNWTFYIPGLEFSNEWSGAVLYAPGDIVRYGGYNYSSKTNNTGLNPVANPSDWSLLTINYRVRGEWELTETYIVGDLVRRNGNLYVAVAESLGQETTATAYWELVVPGEFWRNGWAAGLTYLPGDLVTYASTAHRCLQKHTATLLNRPGLDATTWVIHVQGDVNNVLQYQGDILTYDSSAYSRTALGTDGQLLESTGSLGAWNNFGVISKVYYVALTGTDAPGYGLTLNAPFRTIKYACANVTGPATIFIKTGTFVEQLPISIPADVALVGDELRSTVVRPDSNSLIQNMFYMRNGTGLRNMTLAGLTGGLGNLNSYLTRRPTAGAYVSLDPGMGPTDSSVWISSKSPYVQNVTTFGTGCVGLKIDGNLHNGGNKSIVANDFTQVLSDGIGVWCTNLGLTELVSVFSYFAHIGYLAENGGKIRATNGNSSYGTYGCSAEGVDLNEVPISSTVNNRTQQAIVTAALAGEANNQILKLEFANCGQNYTTASFAFSGAGFGAVAVAEEFRDKGIYQARILGPSDSSVPGGNGYITAGNNAQDGDNLTITLASNDQRTASNYIGMRIIVVSGTGIGQYGYIQAYNAVSKIVTVYKESNSEPGWDHVNPGTTIQTTLDTTTVYSIEPRPTFSSPLYTNIARTMPALADWTSVSFAGTYVAVARNTNVSAYSTNGTSWTAAVLPSSSNWNEVASGLLGSTNTHVAVANNSTTAAYSTDGGATWQSSGSLAGGNGTARFIAYGNQRFVTLRAGSNIADVSTTGSSWSSSSTITWTDLALLVGIAYGGGKFVAISSSGTGIYSADNGATWTQMTLASNSTWVSITYGSGKFLAVSTTGSTMYSFDGITWTNSPNVGFINVRHIAYGQGLYYAIQNGGSVATSSDGLTWTTRSAASTANWSGVVFGNATNTNLFVGVAEGTTNAAFSSNAGAPALGRVVVSSNRISLIKLWEPGSGYTTTPTLTITDPNVITNVQTLCRLGNGVLANPTFTNRGTAYQTSTTTVTVSGNGYSDNYQTGRYLIVSNLSSLPGPGANLNIFSIKDVTYRIVGVLDLGGGSARLQISPLLDPEESPDHNVVVTIRQKYSQVRLTGHDFLSIGTGNAVQTNYPNTNLTNFSQFAEIVEGGGGRCFYTSTDQDGNFRVGELFKVEQSTGIVTISADFFALKGLEELVLGGVAIGGSAVVIREFSTDGTFTADSNNIIPTQKAIKTYIARRISGGGSDAQTGVLIAGTVLMGPQVVGTTTGGQVNMLKKVNFTKGVDGVALAMSMFAESFSND